MSTVLFNVTLLAMLIGTGAAIDAVADESVMPARRDGTAESKQFEWNSVGAKHLFESIQLPSNWRVQGRRSFGDVNVFAVSGQQALITFTFSDAPAEQDAATRLGEIMRKGVERGEFDGSEVQTSNVHLDSRLAERATTLVTWQTQDGALNQRLECIAVRRQTWSLYIDIWLSEHSDSSTTVASILETVSLPD